MNMKELRLLMISAFILIIYQPFFTQGVPVDVQPPVLPDSASPRTRDVLEGLEFLKVYQYLVIDPGKETTLPTSEEITSALVNMQRFAGIRQTGEFDDHTLLMMSRPRCGVADVIVRNDSARLRRYSIAGINRYRWFTNDLTYKIENYPTNSLTNLNTVLAQDQVDGIIAQAFKVWSDVSPLTFTRVQSDSNDNADIHLLFGSRKHTNVYQDPVFDGEGGTLAHAFTPNSGWGSTNGDVHFDDDETYTHMVYSGANLFYTAAHEIGHALGLDHSDNKQALMWPYDRGFQPNFELPADDIAGIQAIYGTKPTEAPTEEPTVEPTLPIYCNITLYAVAVIYQKLYVFSDTLLWQFSLDGDLLTNPDGEDQRDHFKDLPRRIIVAYERWYDGKVVFFKGKKFYVYDGSVAETPKGGLFITKSLDKRLPKSVTAALHSGENGQTDFFRSKKLWRYDGIKRQLVKGFPQRSTNMFPELPRRPSGAFFDKHGQAVILHQRQYLKYTATNDGTYLLTSNEADPRNFATDYLQCPQIA